MTKINSSQSISIVVPALNEEEVVADIVSDIVAVLEDRFQDFEIILVNDGSTDRTGAIMNEIADGHPKVRVVHNERNQGLGSAYKLGIAQAKFEYLMLLCGDGGLPASSLPPIFDAIGSADIIAPYMVNLKRIKTPSRYVMSRSYTGLLNLLFRQNIKYYNGLAVHRTALLRQITISSTRFAFQGEVMTKLLKAGCSCVQIGVQGAENTNKSSALRLRNLANVGKTLLTLVWEIIRFDSSKISTKVPQ
ncbi:hypothetical protein SAE02_44680 [Skermanella aerolata]|uniref:Glycosyltransferase 2-like domain-containing protein n=1 Tax=Skermanella aerolata TaxID=393310 RepID=A0A512DVP0_9PROT|nr:glycosyltransferase family 2 protein [Skermanella aerolata]KJB94952.1 hypothetical protein N826_07705 [Skermanella aerolata KACC 11604]GEO40320.1 hypothetical protein SAE02_44680 [Skermanella aerolata]